MILNEELREIYQNKAIERAEYYSIDNTMIRWENLLQKIKVYKR